MHAKLQRMFATDPRVRVIFDRRADDRRNRFWVRQGLRVHGFAIVHMFGHAKKPSKRLTWPSEGLKSRRPARIHHLCRPWVVLNRPVANS